MISSRLNLVDCSLGADAAAVHDLLRRGPLHDLSSVRVSPKQVGDALPQYVAREVVHDQGVSITIPRYAAQYEETWRARWMHPPFADPMAILGASKNDDQRDDAMEQLLEAAEALDLPGWRLNDYRTSRAAENTDMHSDGDY